MRIILFFDLPTDTAEGKGNYQKFRRFLLTSGFVMMQKSVYCKLVLNASGMESIIASIRKNKPSEGIVQILTVTEKQFQSMEYITGEFHSETIESDERLVVL